MRDAKDLADQIVDTAGQAVTATGEPGVPLEEGHHGCSEGWKIGPDGAYRCPECEADRELHRVSRELLMAGVGERYWSTSWDDLEQVEPFPQLRAAADRIGTILSQGDHLLLSGPPGSGKTQAAVLLVRAAIEARHTAAIMNLGRAGMEIRAAYKREDGPTEESTVKWAARADLLVIDDLAAGETNAASLEQRLLYLVLEERQNAQRSTIVTTNLSPEEATEHLGQRLIGRLQPLAIMEFEHGQNFRRAAGKTSWEAP